MAATVTSAVSGAVSTASEIVATTLNPLPAGIAVDPPALTFEERAKQKNRASKVMGTVAVGGAVAGYAAGMGWYPVKAMNGRAAKLAAYSVAIFALILAALLHKRYMDAAAMSGTVEAR